MDDNFNSVNSHADICSQKEESYAQKSFGNYGFTVNIFMNMCLCRLYEMRQDFLF